MKKIFETVVQTLKDNRPIALVTVVRSIGSTPRHAAAKMAVCADGTFVGTIGGGSMEHKAIQDAQEALAAGEQHRIKYPLNGRTAGSMGLCGGTEEVFIDVLDPRSENNDETRELFETIVAACEAGEPAALVTIIQAANGLDWERGAKVLVRYDASTFGTLGNEALSTRIVSSALNALEQNHSARLGYQPHDDTLTTLSSYDRRPLEAFVDVVQPRPELLIIGAGHIGLALAAVGQTLGMRVVIVDDRSEWAARFPDADEVIIVPYDAETETLDPIPITVTPTTHIVVATWGWDEPALEQIASSPAPYISLVASRRKAQLIFEELVARGVPHEDLARIRVPAGLDLGAETPEEIALSIMAEMLLLHRNATGRPMLEIKGHPLALVDS